ncbi:hypothetical protein BGZ65_002251, partial [Modicella reniformis]
MRLFTAIGGLILSAVTAAQAPTFTNCAAGLPDLNVTSISMSPFPPCIGQTMCFNLTSTLSAPITEGGRLTFEGRYLRRRIYVDEQDACGVLAVQGQPCPIPTTSSSLKVCILLKPTIPA